MQKKKKRASITKNEALARISSMVEKIQINVKTALWAEATLEAANSIVTRTKSVKRPGALAYDTVSKSLMLNLAISLARLFDAGSKRFPPNKRDIASIPLLIRLLKQKRCRTELTNYARQWTPHLPHIADRQAEACNHAIDNAIKRYVTLLRSRKGQRQIKSLKDFRNKILAHTLMDDVLSVVPIYNDLYDLMDAARDITDSAIFATQGLEIRLDEQEKSFRKVADAFWSFALQDRGFD